MSSNTSPGTTKEDSVSSEDIVKRPATVGRTLEFAGSRSSTPKKASRQGKGRTDVSLNQGFSFNYVFRNSLGSAGSLFGGDAVSSPLRSRNKALSDSYSSGLGDDESDDDDPYSSYFHSEPRKYVKQPPWQNCKADRQLDEKIRRDREYLRLRGELLQNLLTAKEKAELFISFRDDALRINDCYSTIRGVQTGELPKQHSLDMQICRKIRQEKLKKLYKQRPERQEFTLAQQLHHKRDKRYEGLVVEEIEIEPSHVSFGRSLDDESDRRAHILESVQEIIGKWGGEKVGTQEDGEDEEIEETVRLRRGRTTSTFSRASRGELKKEEETSKRARHQISESIVSSFSKQLEKQQSSVKQLVATRLAELKMRSHE